ncbi:MAG: RNA polymerase sigma factor [Chlorobi bacterium]|nr:RNA polymerase sigma factor [Chlorobiota bacterium]
MTVKEYNQSVGDYADALFRFLTGNLREQGKAEDIVQETFEKLWVKLETVNYEKVKSYLFATAYHTMIDWIRKEKRMVLMEDSELNEPSFTDQVSDLNEILHEALQRLPEDQRSVILLRDYEGYAYREIAEITGLSESQVKVYIYRGRMFLKKYIGSIEVLV